MNNIEILKLVKSNKYNGYRAVLDKTLADDVKHYSYWGDSRLLYSLSSLLVGPVSLNLLRNGIYGKVKQIVRSSGSVVKVNTENRIVIPFYSKPNLEMDVRKFFILYDKYNNLILNGAHEIILKREDNEFLCEGKWYIDDSPFNKFLDKKYFKVIKERFGYKANGVLGIIIDEDQYSNYSNIIYRVFQEFYPVLTLNNINYSYIADEDKFYEDIKNNIDKLIGETISDKNYVSIEIKSKNMLKVNMNTLEINEEGAPVFEINLDKYFKIYFDFKDLKEQNADEIIFIEENDEIKLEGVWYDNKNNKIKIS